MGSRIQVLFLVFSIQISAILAETNADDLSALNALKSSWSNLPPNWSGTDPCGSNWDGIGCNNSRVVEIKLSGIGLEGTEFGDLGSFTELQHLDLSNNLGLKGTLPSSIGNLKNLTTLILVGCSFFGPIPDSIGSLQQLVFISLTSNSFNGPIPRSIGNLSKLSWLDLSDNKLSGDIPVSNGSRPGLDNLTNTRHFHLSQNQLSGRIPEKLFSPNMKLIHVILDHNQLRGEIPPTLGLVRTLEVVRLDSNTLSGSVPDTLNSLKGLNELYLSNNNLTGPLPNLSSMNTLHYLDMSNNSFEASVIPGWLSSLLSLTTVHMVNTTLQGSVPVNFFSLPLLETVELSNNNLSGTLDIGSSYPKNLTVDLQNNSIVDFTQKNNFNMKMVLTGNPICKGNEAKESYCVVQNNNNPVLSSDNCPNVNCGSGKIQSPTCKCSHPQTGTLHFFSFAFSNFENLTYFRTLNGSLMSAFLSRGLPVDSVSVTAPTIDVYSYLQFRVQIFPSGQDTFNRTGYSDVGFLLNRQPFDVEYFGPFFYKADEYCCFGGSKKSSHTGIIVGVAVGASVFVVLLVCVAVYAFRQRSRANRATEKGNPFASWNPDKSGSVPQLKGARWLSFEEMRKCTDNFSDANCIGVGGYGKVYKGLLATRELVAIKRAQQGSMQGALEFKTEIELLSRIHHKNVVNLVGFCYEQGEQMLVYEYIPNGTLRESLSGKSGIQLNWMRRLKIALDAARGLAYLHELADPPIIHRDVKSNNILLDDNLNAKVADFGLSKLLGDAGKGHVSTQVKGTLGYLDPEYYMTQQLTDRSDVYSFGVVLLELITARPPIERGKHIVRVVSEAMDDQKDSSKLDQVVDRILTPHRDPDGLQKFINLGMSCVQESAAERPSMGEVVREIENIIQMAGKVLTSSSSFGEGSNHGIRNSNSYDNSKAFDYSGTFLSWAIDM
ncbi:probable leucine-rich repeat receptor-like protein kinase At5g49770 isoform X1 [Ipomoea triloba]|uniref:probable leucine-rich repeat receptor-like protein kinase At5g49770 isoform X1 n=2 Tax=Ipomoea triloba TaxID=35885 RepID=UPI00125E7EB7|nr:probable leucine-rich repeat receptor-like protein kinase At5g49770 isoform X1 [Ipomoea triloba]